ncbi:alpha/beta hydrolase [Spiractinospora alimapuensis]|uniref:alpha/beta fold hydrolase n=1 Tax=Spiractinospora alimapuensis TaxID=2820884 RepID=UPI001F241CFB|nr:alpha/beta hydrolase [Spiractinospora alimapuensis]QVQ53012.1 alpha/beta hydrolase [Spiractinospora alimapuensis]
MNTYGEPPTRVGQTTLDDGRVLGWAEWGPRDGVPVVLCPGAGTSRSLGLACGVPDAVGARLISVDRPGLGVSSPDPGRTLRDFATDLENLTSLRDIGHPAVVGNSQGAPFALACAAMGTASAVAVVAGADEVAAPEFAADLPPELHALVEAIDDDPAGVEADFLTFTADRIRNMVLSRSPTRDLAVYKDPGFDAAYRRALAEGFAQGAVGYARDTVLAMDQWDLPLSAITVPVDIWYGTEDTTHSPDRGRFLATRIAGAERHLVPDAGGSLLWTHGERVLGTLLARTPTGRGDPR